MDTKMDSKMEQGLSEETFSYSYSASRQEEIKNIRDKYAPPVQEEDKLEQLRRLDRSVTWPGTIISIIIGFISTLVLGVGMCCTLVWTNLFALGVVVGLVGIAGIIAAYPVYSHITKKQREKLVPEILRLSDELLK